MEGCALTRLPQKKKILRNSTRYVVFVSNRGPTEPFRTKFCGRNAGRKGGGENGREGKVRRGALKPFCHRKKKGGEGGRGRSVCDNKG